MTTVSFEAEKNDGLLFLRQEWISGTGEGVKFNLDCGAGLGSPSMCLTVEAHGKRVTEIVDIREGLTAWVNRLVDELSQEEA